MKYCLKLFFILILVALSIYATYKFHEWYRYAPKINPKPKYFMTVRGRIDPKLSNNIKIQWIATYYSTNKACEFTVNWFEGVKSYRKKIFTYLPKAEKNNQYQHRFALDKYKLGFCNWKIETIGYKISTNNKIQHISTIFFTSEKDCTKHDAERNLICINNNVGYDCEYKKKASFTNKMPSRLYNEGDYKYSINIIKGNSNDKIK